MPSLRQRLKAGEFGESPKTTVKRLRRTEQPRYKRAPVITPVRAAKHRKLSSSDSYKKEQMTMKRQGMKRKKAARVGKRPRTPKPVARKPPSRARVPVGYTVINGQAKRVFEQDGKRFYLLTRAKNKTKLTTPLCG
jgi:hypothetical protein